MRTACLTAGAGTQYALMYLIHCFAPTRLANIIQDMNAHNAFMQQARCRLRYERPEYVTGRQELEDAHLSVQSSLVSLIDGVVAHEDPLLLKMRTWWSPRAAGTFTNHSVGPSKALSPLSSCVLLRLLIMSKIDATNTNSCLPGIK